AAVRRQRHRRRAGERRRAARPAPGAARGSASQRDGGVADADGTDRALRADRRPAHLVSASTPIVRLGAVSYLNTRPLVEGLAGRPDVALRFDVPARCADLVAAGQVDLGLVPIIEYARHDDYAVVPDVSI